MSSQTKEKPTEYPLWLSLPEAAALVSSIYFEVSPRTLERWPVVKKLINRKLRVDRDALVSYAERMIAEAPAAGRLPTNRSVGGRRL